MNDDASDLTDEERQTAAKLESLMTRVRASAPSDAPIDELWPDIRARIEASKVAPLGAQGARSLHRRRVVLAVALVGAAALALVLVPTLRRAAQPLVTPTVPPESTVVTGANAGTPIIAVTDSERVYAEEARLLLNRLELERSMLRPETARALDRDLRVIDQAIVELKDAIARDPRNPALHQLLASSYREKAELLKRVANAG